jgi:hypothetical protein
MRVLHYKSRFGAAPTYCGKVYSMLPKKERLWYDPEPSNRMADDPRLCPDCAAEYGLRLLRKQTDPLLTLREEAQLVAEHVRRTKYGTL